MLRGVRSAILDRVGLQLRDFGHYPQVTTAGRTWSRRIIFLGRFAWLEARPSGFSDGIGERFEVIAAGLECLRIGSDAHHLPAAWSGKPVGVHLAQVVTVRFGVGGKRADHSGGIGIDIRERRNRRLGARRLGTTTTTHARHASAVIPR